MATLGISRRTRVEWNGDDTFQCYQQPSEKALLNGELFKEKERVFLKKTLRLHNVSFPIGHDRTVQIELKSFWQPEALTTNSRGARAGRFVTLLSDDRPPIKDAFAWIKLVRPLYKKGFSVILLDLPGMGGSGCNANITVEHADWEAEDFRIVENALRGLKVARTHLVAFGKACRIILKFAKHTHIDGYSTFLAKEHCWYQPDIDFFALFRDEVGDCPPGKVHEWQIEAKKHHEHLLREVMKPVRIMAFHEIDPVDEAVKATQEFIALARSSEASVSEFYCSHVAREDICFVRAHAALDVSIMAMAKNLMTAMVEFLANQSDALPKTYVSLKAVKEGIFASCSKGCVNPARGLHHWSCPNHPKNAQGPAHSHHSPGNTNSKEDAEPVKPPKDEHLMHRSGGPSGRPRPASAPARRIAGRDDRASLEKAMQRGQLQQQRTWVVSSQKDPALAIPSTEATMRSCLYRVKELNPPMLAAEQHQASVQVLPSDMRQWTLAAQEVFNEREAAIAKAKKEEEDRLEALTFRPKTMAETDALEAPDSVGSPEVDSIASEVPLVQPKFSSNVSTDDFLMGVDWRHASGSPKAPSNQSSKLAFVAKLQEVPLVPPSEVGSFWSSPRESPISDRTLPEPESPGVAPSEGTQPDDRDGSRPGSAKGRRRPASAKRAKRPASAVSSTRPPSGTGTASTMSRPSSAARLRDLFSSKLSRLARPSSALSRSSSSTKLSLEPAQGATIPSSPPAGGTVLYGNLAAWFNDRRSLLTR